MGPRSRPDEPLESEVRPAGVAGPGRAIELAYRFINRRERSESEVRARLERAEFSPAEIDAAVGELVELGYVDDARYARLFTQDRRTLDSWGSDRIARVLRERGIDRELISSALEGAPSEVPQPDQAVGRAPEPAAGWSPEEDPGDDLSRAIALLSARFPGGPTSDRDHNRAFGVLARKGYESEVAADAVRAWVRVTQP